MTIQFSELAGQIFVPTIAVETDLDAGRIGLPSLRKRYLVAGYKTTAGSAANGEVHRIGDVADAIEKWGKGSHVAVMIEAALRVSARIELYGMSYAEGGGAAAATGTVTLATAATGNGTLAVHVAGRLFRVGISSGDTPTQIGADLALAINAHPNLPVTAANAVGVVTLTARNGGPEGNTIRIRSSITPGVAMTSTDSGATLASGATAGDPATALADIKAQRFHIIALNTSDATAGGSLETHQEAQSSALEQKWGFGIVPATGAVSTATAQSAAFDSYRMQVVWHPSSDQPEFELSAAFGAERARVVTRNQTLNYHKLPGITAQFDETAWPDRADLDTAITGGVAPLRPLRNGETEIVRNILAKAQSSSPAFIDAEVNEISDFIDEDLISQAKLKFGDAALKFQSPANTPNVLTPARFLLLLHERMRLWDLELDYTQGAELDIEAGSTQATQNATDPNRLDVGYPFRPVFGAHVIAIKKIFTTPPLNAAA